MSLLYLFRRANRLSLITVKRFSSRTVDLSEPHLWFPQARKIQRKIICHVGSTNSGKTYNALTALSYARTGIYCGPLRLLAWEVSEKMREKNVRCNLLTGQEKDILEDATHVSCTVEMVDLRRRYDVAVIDECQLLGDISRGWAWTNALLGVQANEIHLCGSPSMLPIIHNLCALTNDPVTVKTYSRLTPLTVSSRALKSFKHIEKGDCVVGFYRQGLYEIKREVEKNNPTLKCCVIYGGLPPDARKQQAQLFSNPTSGYDVLVASDAIGMGLNLAIRRIIFSTMEKFDGRRRRNLLPIEIKQIAGRAGRFGTLYEDGLVTTMRTEDMKLVRQGMETLDKPITRAGLFPSLEQLELLGVLLDYKVNDELMKAFWNDLYTREWGTNDDDTHSSRNDSLKTMTQEIDNNNPHHRTGVYNNNTSAASILEQFGSVKEFSRQLELFLTTSDEYKLFSDKVFLRIERAKEMRRLKMGSHHLPAALDHSLTPGKGSSDKTISTSSSHVSPPSVNSSDINKEKREDHIHHDQGREPYTINLSNLLSMFYRRAEMDESGKYFLCDLAEKTAVAQAIDDIPLTFRHRYTFCMAPVDADNEELLSRFRTFAMEFSRFGKVGLHDSVVNHRIPKTPNELLTIETMHRVFDVYLWLGQHFPLAFIDMEAAKFEAKQCAYLVDVALRSFDRRKINTTTASVAIEKQQQQSVPPSPQDDNDEKIIHQDRHKIKTINTMDKDRTIERSLQKN